VSRGLTPHPTQYRSFRRRNARGIRLLQYLATTGLEIANIGAEPTFVAGNKRTVIDITLASELLMQYIHAWEVSKEDTMSDHRRINFLLEQDIVATPDVQTGRCLTIN